MNNSPSAFASFGLAILLAMPGALLAGPGGFANGPAFSGGVAGGSMTQGAAVSGNGASFGQGGFRGAVSAPAASVSAPAFAGGVRSGSIPSVGFARPGIVAPTVSSPTFRQRTLPPARSAPVQPATNPAGWPQTGNVAREAYLQARAGRTTTAGVSGSQRTAGQARTGNVPARGGYYRQPDANLPRFNGIPYGTGIRSISPPDANRRHDHQRPQYSCPWYYGNIFVSSGYGYGYGYGYGNPYYSYSAPYDYSGLSFTSPETYDYSNVPSVEPAPTDTNNGSDLNVPPPPVTEEQSKDTPSVERRTSPGLPPEPNTLVQEVQKELTHRGYFSGNSDGIVTRDFQEALRRFQVDQRLVSSGLINQASLYALGLN